MDEMTSNDSPCRRRGRPSGKNRIPLSLDERRARNAQYERERRYETTAAICHLAEAAGCDPTLNNAEILATVISQLRTAAVEDTSNDILELKRWNAKLMQQIASIERRLSNWEDIRTSSESHDNVIVSNRKRRNKVDPKESKRIKTESENSIDVTLATPSSNIYNNQG